MLNFDTYFFKVIKKLFMSEFISYASLISIKILMFKFCDEFQAIRLT